ncbi:MAG: glucoamylase family protein, partial [Saprospiraceae bacterium]
TQSLQPLHPRYVSTVDSGNLAGYLLTLRQGLLALPAQKCIEPKSIRGLLDTLRLLSPHLPVTAAQIEALITEGEKLEQATPFSVFTYGQGLKELSVKYQHLRSTLSIVIGSEAWRWAQLFDDQLGGLLDEFATVAPWLAAPVPEKFKPLTDPHEHLSLAELGDLDQTVQAAWSTLIIADNTPEEKAWLETFDTLVKQASRKARERMALIADLAAQCYHFADMEFDFLYDNSQHLLAIGYNVEEHRRDGNFYDLLASEARLGVFLAIAQGKIPQESWFALGRRLTAAGNTPVLLSWSGSMFEYLMPWLVMPNYENTLLDETGKGSVKKQIEYGNLKNVPWGISESGYNVVDAGSVYQYRAFGVPGLGFKSGLGLDLVIAPYATVMALMIQPQAAYNNLEKLRKAGYEGMYGFYEAIDFTPARLARGKTEAVIKSFMVHHQGMSLLSLVYLLLEQPMQKRFEADPAFQTALLLLQEQIPKTIGYYSGSSELEETPLTTVSAELNLYNTPHTDIPAVQLLSNGSYHTMVTNAGGGYSQWKDLAVTRWREDATQDNWGSFCYLRNLDTGEFWSAAYHPTLKKPSSYLADFSQGRVEFRRLDGEIETYTEVVVSPEDDIEIRRIHLNNQSRSSINIEITSYCEIVLTEAAADNAHPAFSNLFVQTEIIAQQQAILGTRRPRSKEERPPWMFHLMKLSMAEASEVSFETNRKNFIGRGHSLADPQVMLRSAPLSNTDGAVLDPIVSVQSRTVLGPNKTIIIDVITGISDTRIRSQHLIDKYQDRHMRDRAFELSWTHKQVVLRQINAKMEDADLYSRLASSIIYANPALRANPNLLLKNQRGQSALWSYSISGDLPIILLKISDPSNMTLVRQLIQAQAYWHLKGLLVDLVILNEDPSTYRQALQDEIQGLIAARVNFGNTGGKQGRIYVRPYDQMPEEDRVLLQTVARVIISDTAGSLAEQLTTKPFAAKSKISSLVPTRSRENT